MKNSNELRQLTYKELEDKLLSLCKTQLQLRMQKSLGETARPHRFCQLRREIARVKTIIAEKVRNGD